MEQPCCQSRLSLVLIHNILKKIRHVDSSLHQQYKKAEHVPNEANVFWLAVLWASGFLYFFFIFPRQCATINAKKVHQITNWFLAQSVCQQTKKNLKISKIQLNYFKLIFHVKIFYLKTSFNKDYHEAIKYQNIPSEILNFKVNI